jgi:hypothetical protein
MLYAFYPSYLAYWDNPCLSVKIWRRRFLKGFVLRRSSCSLTEEQPEGARIWDSTYAGKLRI